MATIKFVLYKSNKRKDGSYPVCLRAVSYTHLTLPTNREV